ncbi:MAG: DNA repair exonuclease [Oscillospiraceae bacterium]|nr:DNA repair exonuclease [Oscillospiraceae bacterium]
MVKILHAADFHLDSAFGALGEDQARQRRQESRGMAEKMVEYANGQGVQLLLLAGDLFDSGDIYGQTGEELALALGSFDGEAVIAPGNHDYYDPHGAYGRILWPENVHIFRDTSLTELTFPQYECRVYGAAFTSPAAPEGDVLADFTAPDDGWTHILLLHGDLGGRDSRYRPLTEAQLAKTGVDYAALGHQHTCSGVCRAGKTFYAYPGCMEGRGFDELGEKGFLCGAVEPGRSSLSFVPFGTRRYEVLTVDVTDSEPLSAVLHTLRGDTGRDIYRIILTGETESPVRLESLRQELADRFYALELRDQTRMKQDIWDRCGDDSLRGLFLRKLRRDYDSAESEAERQKIEQAVRFGLAAMDNREI